jgi:hypothetical protein
VIGCLIEMPELKDVDYLPATFKVHSVALGPGLANTLLLFRTSL